MPTPTYTITCTRNDLIAKDVYACAFTKPEGFTFKPGQFVLFRVPLVDNPADIQPRAYSIASAPHEPELFFVIKLKEGGRASRWIVETLKPGVTVDMQGPFGVFTIPPAATERIVCIGTSTGIAPFLSMVRAMEASKDARRIDLVFGVRSEEDLFLVDELTGLSRRHEPFSVHFSLSQPPPSWTGHKGRVQHVVPIVFPDVSARRVMLCGNPAMVDEVKALCRDQWGVPKERLQAEGYI